mmetsp:Transcript_4213/g.6496  ORF Transcript_4213/g.6496 Transcript_4213/m.6496 type:complete len:83 (+) Transcript_4213:491-739(+)
MLTDRNRMERYTSFAVPICAEVRQHSHVDVVADIDQFCTNTASVGMIEPSSPPCLRSEETQVPWKSAARLQRPLAAIRKQWA